MNIFSGIKKNKYFYFAILFAFLNMAAVFLIFGFQKDQDTASYLEAIRWFSRPDLSNFLPNFSFADFLTRFSRPLPPILAVPFQFLGEGAGLIVQNSIFYLLCAILIFKLTDLIFNNKKQAFFASILFVSAPPVLNTGLAYMADTGSWFFYILSLYLTLLYFKSGKEGLIPLNGFLSGLGVLMKETGGAGILFFTIMILFSKNFNIKEKLLKIARFAALFLLPLLVWDTLMFSFFNYTHLDLYFHTGKAYLYTRGLQIYIDHGVSLFGSVEIIGWALIAVGFRWLWQQKAFEKLKLFLALLPSSLSFFLWPYNDFRIGFGFVPLGALLASSGLIFLGNKMGKWKKVGIPAIILSYLIINYYFYSIKDFVPFIDLKDVLNLL